MLGKQITLYNRVRGSRVQLLLKINLYLAQLVLSSHFYLNWFMDFYLFLAESDRCKLNPNLFGITKGCLKWNLIELNFLN